MLILLLVALLVSFRGRDTAARKDADFVMLERQGGHTVSMSSFISILYFYLIHSVNKFSGMLY